MGHGSLSASRLSSGRQCGHLLGLILSNTPPACTGKETAFGPETGINSSTQAVKRQDDKSQEALLSDKTDEGGSGDLNTRLEAMLLKLTESIAGVRNDVTS